MGYGDLRYFYFLLANVYFASNILHASCFTHFLKSWKKKKALNGKLKWTKFVFAVISNPLKPVWKCCRRRKENYSATLYRKFHYHYFYNLKFFFWKFMSWLLNDIATQRNQNAGWCHALYPPKNKIMSRINSLQRMKIFYLRYDIIQTTETLMIDIKTNNTKKYIKQYTIHTWSWICKCYE